MEGKISSQSDNRGRRNSAHLTERSRRCEVFSCRTDSGLLHIRHRFAGSTGLREWSELSCDPRTAPCRCAINISITVRTPWISSSSVNLTSPFVLQADGGSVFFIKFWDFSRSLYCSSLKIGGIFSRPLRKRLSESYFSKLQLPL